MRSKRCTAEFPVSNAPPAEVGGAVEELSDEAEKAASRVLDEGPSDRSLRLWPPARKGDARRATPKRPHFEATTTRRRPIGAPPAAAGEEIRASATHEPRHRPDEAAADRRSDARLPGHRREARQVQAREYSPPAPLSRPPHLPEPASYAGTESRCPPHRSGS